MGIPEQEVRSVKFEVRRKAFGLSLEGLFRDERPGYMAFVDKIDNKSAIKTTLEENNNLKATLATHHDHLEAWWTVARDDFAQLRDGKKMPEVRQELLTTIKDKLIPLKVLDEFQSAGVFVNWWQQIRYDLKTIISTGWHHSLIPDEYLIAEFFQSEADAIEALEARISELQSQLAEAVESAQEVAAYEPDEGEKISAAVIKKALKALIDDLKDSSGSSAQKESKALAAQAKAIAAIEKDTKEAKADLKTKTDELALKLQLKRLGGEEFKAESQTLIAQVNVQLTTLDPKDKTDKKKIGNLTKDKAALEARLAKTDGLLKEINGQLTEEQARQLILKKLYCLANAELERYLNAEKRELIQVVENLWDKYAISSRKLESERADTLETLDGFLKGLGYLEISVKSKGRV